MKQTVSFIIPNFNGEALLKKNVPQLLKIAKGVQVVVVDDGSTDGSVSYLKTLGNKITLIEKATNSGFATTVNLGIKAARGDIIVLLNTDVVPKPNFLEPLLLHFADPTIFAVGCLDESHENGKVIKRGRGIGTFSRGLLIHCRGEVDQTSTLWVSGGSSAFRKSMWENLGGLDEEFDPFYWEDIDLSYRAQKRGYHILFEPKSAVIHTHSEGAIKNQYSSKDIETIAYRNQFMFMWKNIGDTSLMVLHILWLPIHLGKAIVSGNVHLLLGFWKAVMKMPHILNERELEGSYWKVSDHEIVAPYAEVYV